MSSYRDFFKRAAAGPSCKSEYDALKPEFVATQAAIDERNLSVLSRHKDGDRAGR